MSSSRRDFFKRLVGTGVAVTALPRCAPDIDPAPVLDVEAPVDGKVALRVGRYPDLLKEGGAVTLRVPGQPNLLVVHPGGDSYAVMDSLCTHVGCPLGFEAGEVVCPCHGSRFDTEGQVRVGPASVALKKYSASYNKAQDTLTIDFRAGDEGFPAAEGGRVFLPFSRFPELRSAGGMVTGTPQGHGKQLFVFALEGGAYSAVDALCTHKFCPVGFQQGSGQLECPCHGSTFDKQGGVTQGPATQPLQRFTATATAEGVTVQLA